MKKTTLILLFTIFTSKCTPSLFPCLCREYVFHKEFKNGNDTLIVHRDKEGLKFTFQSDQALQKFDTVAAPSNEKRVINGRLEITASKEKGILKVKDTKTQTTFCDLKKRKLFKNLSGKTGLKSQKNGMVYLLRSNGSTQKK